MKAIEDGLKAAGADQDRAAELHLGLAKLHEHRTKDLAQALVHAAKTQPEEDRIEQARRVARLERRLKRRAELEAQPKRLPRSKPAELVLVL